MHASSLPTNPLYVNPLCGFRLVVHTFTLTKRGFPAVHMPQHAHVEVQKAHAFLSSWCHVWNRQCWAVVLRTLWFEPNELPGFHQRKAKAAPQLQGSADHSYLRSGFVPANLAFHDRTPKIYRWRLTPFSVSPATSVFRLVSFLGCGEKWRRYRGRDASFMRRRFPQFQDMAKLRQPDLSSDDLSPRGRRSGPVIKYSAGHAVLTWRRRRGSFAIARAMPSFQLQRI